MCTWANTQTIFFKTQNVCFLLFVVWAQNKFWGSDRPPDIRIVDILAKSNGRFPVTRLVQFYVFYKERVSLAKRLFFAKIILLMILTEQLEAPNYWFASGANFTSQLGQFPYLIFHDLVRIHLSTFTRLKFLLNKSIFQEIWVSFYRFAIYRPKNTSFV